jgi:signal transduction histidine kinase
MLLVDEQTGKPAPNPIAAAYDSGQIQRGGASDSLRSRKGNDHPVAITAAPIRKSDNTLQGIVAVLRDVSREREIDRMKKDFVSSVSHELRTPLTSIKAFTATILRDPAMPEDTRNEFLHIIDEESNRLADLIEDLLDISRIESGTLKIASEPVQLTEILHAVVPALQPLAAKKDITLSSQVDSEISEITGDAGKLQSVLTNLVNNAIKFTPAGGSVAVRLFQQDDRVVASVKDTGMGIPADALEKVFDRFYRVHRPGMEIQGTGLGLAIVKEIVHLHGGRIEVTSEINKGSEFIVTLPVSAPVPAMT